MSDEPRQKLRVLDLFSGIGGFSLGLERTGGFETVAFCEIDPFCRKVLKKHWPDVPCFEDVRTIDYEADHIKDADVVTAGFPCQDISYAGAGAGLAGERSGLWWMVRRTLRLVRPRLALLENVAALLDRGMGTVLGSMASIGYDAEWHSVPLSAFGAPHRRDRVCILAYPQGERCAEAWEFRYRELQKWISRCCQAPVSPNARQERSEGVRPQEVSGIGAFSWCQDVRGAADLRERPDLPPPLFRGSRDGVPDWVERIESCGNSFSPIQVEAFGHAILEAERQVTVDKPCANLRPVMYLHRVHELQTIARANGYCLALHGSMQRDLDAIAVPWTKRAVPAERLVEQICDQMGLTPTNDSPADKEHGRRVWSLLMGEIGFVDFSIMPRH